MPVGSDLRNAREKLGLSAEQISDRTKIQLPKIEALERGAFNGLPGGIYLDGIVRAYANEVGLPAEPLIDHVRQERAEAVADSAPADLSGFHSEKELILSSQGRPTGDPAPTRSIDFVIDHPLVPPLPHAAVARDYPSRRRTKSNEPGAVRSFGRAFLMLALLAAIGWGAYSFQIYRLANRDRTAALPAPPRGGTDKRCRRDRNCGAPWRHSARQPGGHLGQTEFVRIGGSQFPSLRQSQFKTAGNVLQTA